MAVEENKISEQSFYRVAENCNLRGMDEKSSLFNDNLNLKSLPPQGQLPDEKNSNNKQHKVIKKLKKGNLVKITSILKNIFKIYFFNREHTRVKCIENGIITNLEGDMRTDCIGDKVDFTEGKMDFLHKDKENSPILPKGNNTRLYVDLIASANIEGLENSSLKRLKLLQYLKLCMKASQRKAWFWDKCPALNLWLKNKKHISEFPQIIESDDRTEVKKWITSIEIDLDLDKKDDIADLKNNNYFQSIDNYEAQAKNNILFERMLKKDQEMPAAHKDPSKEIELSFYNESISSGMDVLSGDLNRNLKLQINNQILGNSGNIAILTNVEGDKFLPNAKENIDYMINHIDYINSIINFPKNIKKFLADEILFDQVYVIKGIIKTLHDKLYFLKKLIAFNKPPNFFDENESDADLRKQYTVLDKTFLELIIGMKKSPVSIKKRNLHLLSNCHQRSQLYLLSELLKAPEYNNIIIPEDGTKLINQDKDQDSVIFKLEQARDDGLYKLNFIGYYNFVFVPEVEGYEGEEMITLCKIKTVVKIFLSNNDKLIYNVVVNDDRADSKPFLLSFTADAFSNDARTAIEKDRSKLLEADQKR